MYLYTKRGMFNEKRKEPSGDVLQVLDKDDFIVLSLADGVSECIHGADGAGIVGTVAMNYVANSYSELHFLPNNWGECMLNIIRKELELVAESKEAVFEEFSSTLMILLIDRQRDIMYYCNIGDGILISVNKEKCPIICMPQCYGSTCPVVTTDGVESIFETGVLSLKNVKNIIMCTDGAWKLIYEHNIIKSDIKEYILNGDFEKFKEYIKSSNSIDDCSFAIIDVGKAA